MFGPLGFTEILVILVLALLLFGPKRLPEIGRTIGKGLSEFRKASNDLKRSIETEIALDEAATRRPAAIQPPVQMPAPIPPSTPESPPPAPAPPADAAADEPPKAS